MWQPMAEKENKIFLILFFLFLINPIGIGYSQEKFDSQFKSGLELFSALKYQDALEIFERLADKTTYNSKTTISYIFAAKSYLHLNQPEKSSEILNKFLELYSDSRYKDEARLTLSKAYLEAKNYSNSFKTLLELIKDSEAPFYKNYAKLTAEKIAVKYLIISDLKIIIALNRGKEIKPFLQLVSAKILLADDNLDDAETALEGILREFPESDERSEAAILLQTVKEKAKALPTAKIIGVMLPLSGSTNGDVEAALEILEGIKFAVSEFNREREDKIGLLIRDTELSRSKIREIKNEIENISIIKSIIGPVYSEEVRFTLEEFSQSNIPIVSPTATDNDLTKIYENFFQANPSFSVRGKIMAQYVYYVENKRSLAILNAIEGYSPLLAATFADEFKKLGGEIIINETYKSTGFSVETQIANINNHLSRIDGIYIPLADKVDAPGIISQLVQKNLMVPIYGNQDWLLARGFESSITLSNNITFSSDYFIDYNSGDFLDFNRRFLNVTGKEINRNILYGYDAAKYILTILRNNYGGREAIKQKMEGGIISTGYRNNISFDELRINKFLNIIRYRDGQFELIDKFKSGS
jgi:ABC-type branched-subunit amino acid transport system substrate-binding protein/predicted negative regulator of RcsB-dependent stress response